MPLILRILTIPVKFLLFRSEFDGFNYIEVHAAMGETPMLLKSPRTTPQF